MLTFLDVRDYTQKVKNRILEERVDEFIVRFKNVVKIVKVSVSYSNFCGGADVC